MYTVSQRPVDNEWGEIGFYQLTRLCFHDKIGVIFLLRYNWRYVAFSESHVFSWGGRGRVKIGKTYHFDYQLVAALYLTASVALLLENIF